MKKNKGFTLIELLVVIAIIGILSGIVLVSMGGTRSKARDAQRTSDIRQLTSAQEMYYGDADGYYATGTLNAVTNGVDAIVYGGVTYLPSIKDPLTTQYYKWVGNGTVATSTFCAFATMENKGTCATTRYFIASEKGTKELCTAPSSLATCW